jgi:hypothetical protein
VKAQTTLPGPERDRKYGFTPQTQDLRKMKEESKQIICSGCGAEMGERKNSDGLANGICDVCLKVISAEEDMVFSEKELPSQGPLPWLRKNNRD